VHFGKQIALGFVRPDYAGVETELTVKMLDRHYPAIVVQDSPYDPDNARARMDSN
jgi:dimethylglycine dehydrogenase